MSEHRLTRRSVLGSAGAILLLPLGSASPAQNAAPTSGRRASIRDFGALGDGRSDDTPAFREAAAALSSGLIDELHLPRGNYRLVSGAFDVNRAPGPILIHGDGANRTQVRLSSGAGQNAFIIRNSTLGTTVRGFTLRSEAPPPSYQHTLVLANISKLLVEDMALEDAQGYGLGIFEDILSSPIIREPCNDLVVRNNRIANASQYGIQHFPKAFSRNAQFYGNTLVNCGCNTQNWKVPGELLPSAMKVGQATAQTLVYRNTIVGAPDAASLDIGNWDDIELFENTVTNSGRQFVAISVGWHPLLSRSAPHRRCIVRDNVFVQQASAPRRRDPALTFASERSAQIGSIEILRNRIVGDNMGTPASFAIRPGAQLRNLKLVGNVWEGVAPEPAIVMLLSDVFGGEIVDPLIQGNQVHNGQGPRRVLRAVQLEGVSGARLVGNLFAGMGENVFDLRHCKGRVLITDNVIDRYNLTGVPGAALIAISGDRGAEYEITSNRIERGSGRAGVLVGGDGRQARVVAVGNSLDAALP